MKATVPPMPPDQIQGLSGDEVDRLLDTLEPSIPTSPPLVRIHPPGVEQLEIIGDTHGDWRSTAAAAAWFLAAPESRAFAGLGDYIDRAPPDCPGGSAVNALFLLSLKAAFPDHVTLLQGNHEAARRIELTPQTIADEMADRWGADARRYGRLMSLLERGPLAAYTDSGLFLAHGGFPPDLPTPWQERFRHVDTSLEMDLLWRDIAVSNVDRGESPAFTEEDLDRFLAATGLSVFVRGHDPRVVGQILYRDRVLTLHTSRTYRRFGGILVARAPLTRPVRKITDLQVESLAVEGPA